MTRLMSWLVAAVLLALPAAAAELRDPAGAPMLEVRGAVTVHNRGDAAVFDGAMLKALPQHEVRTETPWTEGMTRFTGVLLRDLLDRVGAKGTVLRMTALNDYAIEVPAADARDFDVLIAMEQDGRPMRVRDKGPLWIIYPLSGVPALPRPQTHDKMIWQLKSIEVR